MKTNIKEYCEKMVVEICYLYPKGWIIKAYNEGGCNWTKVDLLDVLKFVKKELPELFEKLGRN